MPRPLTVFKNGKSVSNVYHSELQAWLDDGWSLEDTGTACTETFCPAPIPKVVTPDRQEELEAMSWQKLKTLATKLGLEKDEDQSWEDLIPQILEAENR